MAASKATCVLSVRIEWFHWRACPAAVYEVAVCCGQMCRTRHSYPPKFKQAVWQSAALTMTSWTSVALILSSDPDDMHSQRQASSRLYLDVVSVEWQFVQSYWTWMWDWSIVLFIVLVQSSRGFFGDAENAGLENEGLNCRGGKCRTSVYGMRND